MKSESPNYLSMNGATGVSLAATAGSAVVKGVAGVTMAASAGSAVVSGTTGVTLQSATGVSFGTASDIPVGDGVVTVDFSSKNIATLSGSTGSTLSITNCVIGRLIIIVNMRDISVKIANCAKSTASGSSLVSICKSTTDLYC